MLDASQKFTHTFLYNAIQELLVCAATFFFLALLMDELAIWNLLAGPVHRVRVFVSAGLSAESANIHVRI